MASNDPNSEDYDVIKDLQEEFIESLKTNFKEIQGLIEELKSTHDRDKFDSLINHIHKLSGSSGSYGFGNLSAAAKILEHNLQEKNKAVDVSEIFANDFETAFNGFSNEVKNALNFKLMNSNDAKNGDNENNDMPAVKLEFLQLLEDRIEQIRMLYKQCLEEFDPNDHYRLYRRLHGLASSAGSHDFTEISDLASQLEGKLSQFITSNNSDHMRRVDFTILYNKMVSIVLELTKKYKVDETASLNSVESANKNIHDIYEELSKISLNSLDYLSIIRINRCKNMCIKSMANIDTERYKTQHADEEERSKTYKISVLVVDDDEDTQRLLRYVIGNAGMRVISANDPRVGIDILRKENPDIVLLDLMMPVMTGFEFLSNISSFRDKLKSKIIVSSSRKYDSDRIGVIEAGADDFIPKPYSMRELILKIQSHINDDAESEGLAS